MLLWKCEYTHYYAANYNVRFFLNLHANLNEQVVCEHTVFSVVISVKAFDICTYSPCACLCLLSVESLDLL